MSSKNKDSIDEGWSWLVVTGALVINAVYDGCSFSFGIIFVHLLDYFEDSKLNTAWVGSLFFSLPLLCGPLANIITSKLGNRNATVIGGFVASSGIACCVFANTTELLYLTFGVIAGIGMSLPYFNRVVMIPKYFENKRGLASGIAESGSGIGAIIFPPLVSQLISVYHWKGGLLIVGGIVANIIVCGVIFRPNSPETKFMETSKPKNLNHYGKNPQELSNQHSVPAETKCSHMLNTKHKLSGLLFIMNIHFILFSLSNFIIYLWYDVPFSYLVLKSTDAGVSESKASFIVSTFGITYTVGNICFGKMVDRQRSNKFAIYGISIVSCGGSMMAMAFFDAYLPLIILAGSFGLFVAANESLCVVILIDIVGEDKLEGAYGLLLFLQGVANLIGPPTAG